VLRVRVHERRLVLDFLLTALHRLERALDPDRPPLSITRGPHGLRQRLLQPFLFRLRAGFP
jgi:hypothetical protein